MGIEGNILMKEKEEQHLYTLKAIAVENESIYKSIWLAKQQHYKTDATTIM